MRTYFPSGVLQILCAYKEEAPLTRPDLDSTEQNQLTQLEYFTNRGPFQVFQVIIEKRVLFGYLNIFSKFTNSLTFKEYKFNLTS